MSRIALIGIVFVMCGLVVERALADFSTPFIEAKNDVGDICEGVGYLLAAGDERSTYYSLLVTSDTEVHTLILCEAEQGVVPSSLIGRPARIKAQVIAKSRPPRNGSALGFQLKLLSVTRPDRSPATKPAGSN